MSLGLRAGGEGDDRRWAGWMASWLTGHGFEQTLGDREGEGSLACCNPRGHRVRHDLVTEWQPSSKYTKCWFDTHMLQYDYYHNIS